MAGKKKVPKKSANLICVPVCFEPADYAVLKRYAASDGRFISHTVRELVLRALGVRSPTASLFGENVFSPPKSSGVSA